MPGRIEGREAERVLKELGIPIPRKSGRTHRKSPSTSANGRKQGKGRKSNWKPGPLDEAMADDLRKKFNIDPEGWTG